MERPEITIRLGAGVNRVSVKEGTQVTHFNRMTMTRPEQAKLRRMLVVGWKVAQEENGDGI